MSRTAKPIPEGFNTVTPYLVVKGAAAAMAFYREALGAHELYRSTCSRSDLILNAKLRIGDSMIMLSDEFPDFGCVGPAAGQPSPVTIHLYVEDVDRFFDRAIAAGATPTMPVSDTFWGDRYGQFTDPFGHAWSVATHIEDLTPDEIEARARLAFA